MSSVLIICGNALPTSYYFSKEVTIIIAPRKIIDEVSTKYSQVSFICSDDFEIPPSFVKSFQSYFESKFEPTSKENLFINLIYESSVQPLARYYFCILEALRVDPCIAHVHLDGENAGYGSTYFMAEHELSRKFLYDRRLWFGAYIKAFAEQKSLKVSLVSNNNNFRSQFLQKSHQVINTTKRVLFSRLRLLTVCFAKIILGLWNQIIVNKRTPVKVSNTFFEGRYVFTSRTVSQTNFFKDFCHPDVLDAHAFVTESASFYGNNNSYLQNKQNEGNWSYQPIKYRRKYFTYLIKLIITSVGIKKTDRYYFFEGFFVNLDEAFDEISVLVPDLISYLDVLEEHLKKIIVLRGAVNLVSGEQKTQYAAGERYLCDKLGIEFVQFIECDHAVTPLPKPIFGKVFFVNSKYNEAKFQKYYKSDKFRYIGQPHLLSRHAQRQKSEILFFSSPRREKSTIIFLKVLFNNLRDDESIILKLHPRDTYNYTKIFPALKTLKHGDMDFEEVVAGCKLAVSYNSTVATRLLDLSIPYIIVRTSIDETKMDLVYTKDNYQNVAATSQELERLLQNPDALQQNFLKLLNDVKHHNGKQELESRQTLIEQFLQFT
jgi:hypothetical protein